ncbi:MAG: flippase-like domain-containing protein [Bacteroidales bacterium]|jgi:uncharacterized protein (TIRG00374 family)|nr:flippase-like domain-containing protein [Bacteroidales bacterium]
MNILSEKEGGFFGKKAINCLFMLCIAAVLLYFSFRGVKWKDFADGLKSCDYRWIGISMIIGFCGIFIRGLRWRLLLLPMNKDIKKKETYNGVSIAMLMNFILPRIGEIIRCGIVAKSKKVSFEKALGSVITERAFDMLTLAAIILIFLAAAWKRFGSFFSSQILTPFSNRLGTGMIMLIFILVLAGVFITTLIWIFRKKLSRFKIFRKLDGIFRELSYGITSAFKMNHKWLFLIQTILLWTSFLLTSYCSIMAFPSLDGLDLSDALFLMIVGSLGWVIPVQGGIGAYHFIVMLALYALYSIPKSSGIVFATVSHESQSLVMIICGLLSLLSVSPKRQIKNTNK